MSNVIINIFKIPELRRKVLFTLFILVIYRVGAHIPIPGINVEALSEYFKKALKFNGLVFLELGNKYSISPNSNIARDALRFYKEAIKFPVQAFEANCGLASYYSNNDIHVLAKIYFENALQLSKTNIWILNQLGWLHLSIKEFDIAKKYFNRVLEIQKDNPEAVSGINNCQ